MIIYIKNKQPIPAIYNVKQYSAYLEIFDFYIPKSEIKLNNFSGVRANIKTINFTSHVNVTETGDFLLLSWSPSAEETKISGSFEIQIELISGVYVWQSYKAAFIVSSSVEGGGTQNQGDIIKGILRFSGLVDEGIRGEINEL